MSTTLQATNNYLLIKMVERKQELASGLILPERTLDRPRWAKVLSVGEGLGDINGVIHKPDFKKDDLVYCFKHGPVKATSKDESYGECHMISEGDIWAKLDLSDSSDPKVLPVGNFVQIEPIHEERLEKTAGGIILPDKVQEKPDRAKVLVVGPGQRTSSGNFVKPIVKPGDVVRYNRHAIIELDFNDLGSEAGKAVLVPYGDIYAVEISEE